MLQILGLIASLMVVAAYLQTTRTKNPDWLNAANALCWPVIAVASAAVGAWPAVIVTVAFGTIGTLAWFRDRSPQVCDMDDECEATPDQRAAAKLASRRGIHLRNARVGWRMPDGIRRQARESLRRRWTSRGEQRR